MIDAVLFDWGGTLTPFHSIDVLALWAGAARVIAPDQADEVAAALLAAERDCWLRTESSLRSFTTEQLLLAACETAGIDSDPAAIEAAALAYRGDWAPYLDSRREATAVLGGLKALGLTTGLLSNTHWPREWHEDALAADGLLDLIDARIYTSELRYMKPHPSAFQALLDAVGVIAERAVFVGDRLHDDVFGAKSVGMRTVWIRNGLVPGYDIEPDATIEHLSELLAVIDAWR